MDASMFSKLRQSDPDNFLQVDSQCVSDKICKYDHHPTHSDTFTTSLYSPMLFSSNLCVCVELHTSSGTALRSCPQNSKMRQKHSICPQLSPDTPEPRPTQVRHPGRRAERPRPVPCVSGRQFVPWRLSYLCRPLTPDQNARERLTHDPVSRPNAHLPHGGGKQRHLTSQLTKRDLGDLFACLR